MNYYIESITVSDGIEQLAPVITLQVLPYNGRVQSLATLNLTGMPLPYTEFNGLLTSVNNAAVQDIVQGQILYISNVDEYATVDGYGYELTLTANSPDTALNRLVTAVHPSPMIKGGYARSLDMFTADSPHQFPFSRLVGVPLRLQHLPDYVMYGTADWVRTSALEALNTYLEPFNSFGHSAYYLRWHNNGAEAHVVQYSKAQRGRYTPQSVISTTVTEARYDPLIFDRPVLCIGGNRWVDNHLTTFTLEGTMTEVITSTTQGTAQLFSGEETWTTTAITYEIDIVLSKIGDNNITLLPTLEENIAQLRSGLIDNLQVRTARVLRRVEQQFSALVGLQSEKVISYVYESRRLNNGVYFLGGVIGVDCGDLTTPEAQTILTYEESIETLFWQGKALPNRLLRTYHSWNSVGVNVGSVTYNYIYLDDTWVRDTVTASCGDPEQITSATIGFWATHIQNLKGLRQERERKALNPLTQWMLLDGEPFEEQKFKDESCTLQTLDTLNGAFTMNLAYAGYDGLRQLWHLAETQKTLETQRARWIETVFNTTLDFNTPLGMAYGTSVDYGYVVALRHTITSDEAKTVVTTRRIGV